MKIAVLADIHGNSQALKAVIEHANNFDIDKYIIAGDHISDCPSPNETLNIIQKLDSYVIKGNREDYILNEIKSIKNEWIGLKQMESVLWTKDSLTRDHINWIDELPETLHIKYKNTKAILLVHGSPDDQFEHLYPHKIKRLTEVLKSIKEDVLICGHSHKPWSIKIDDKLAINPGSVGVAFNQNVAADYAIMEWDGNQWNVEHFSISYDIKELENDFKLKEIDHFIWSKLVIQSLKDGINRNIEFLKIALDIMENRGIDKKSYIPNHIWEEAIQSWEDIHPPSLSI